MSEEVIPFYIPAPSGGATGVVAIPDAAINDQDNLIEMTVLSGGPVFAWFGRQTATDAKAAIHPSTPLSVDFDMAANAQHCSQFSSDGVGALTVAADVESWGYFRIIGR